MARESSHRARSLSAAVLLGVLAAGQVLAGPETRLDPQETVGGLLESTTASAGDAASAGVTPGGLFARMVVVAAGVVATGLALLFVGRRFVRRAAFFEDGAAVRVVGRTALSPRHTVYVVRIGERRVAVGVSGDRMTPLLVMGATDGDESADLAGSRSGSEGVSVEAPEDRRRLPSRWTPSAFPLVRED